MKKKEIDKKLIQFVNEGFFLNNEEHATLISEMFINANSGKKDFLDSPAILNVILKFVRFAVETDMPTSIQQLLNNFYNINYSYIEEDLSKITIDIIKLHSKTKKNYHINSLLDMAEMIELIESCTGDIISKSVGDKKTELSPDKKLETQFFFTRIVKIHSACCALKEIAYARSIMNDPIDMQLCNSVMKIALYSSITLNKADTFLINPKIHNMILSTKGHENIKKRWTPHNSLKKESIKLAETLWSKGDKRLHHEMAKHIYKTIQSKHAQLLKDVKGKYSVSRKFEGLSPSEKFEKIKILAEKSLIKTIRTAIIPVAEKYNRVWGTKKSK